MKLSKGILFSISLLTGILFFGACQKPPEDTLQAAKSALDSASVSGAPKYAAQSYREAESTLQSARMEIARQKARLGPFRNFKLADSLLSRAIDLADLSTHLAYQQIEISRNKAIAQRNALKDELQEWRDALNGSLLSNKAKRHWSAADLQLKICDRLIENGEFDAAVAAVHEGRTSLRQLDNLLAEYADDESQGLSQWRKWVQETITDSRKDRAYAVIVDKSAHKTYLVHKGNLTRTYSCEIGFNSAHQKMFANDGSTPEGKYRAVKVRQNGSKYYKAILLDYPNSADEKRFRANKSKGIISKHAPIGKNIEIHGEGDKNRDWTDGCVALVNRDMDDILKYVKTGTPVTIVRRSDQWP
jgi:L,D-peptidoglycan transpeptidase YkuD (ErfK/YbiS/YcfS/YnhG family)